MWHGVLGLFIVVFSWGFLSSAGIVNCIILLCTWTSASVSTREGVGDLHSWRAERKAEKRISQKGRGKSSISRRASLLIRLCFVIFTYCPSHIIDVPFSKLKECKEEW